MPLRGALAVNRRSSRPDAPRRNGVSAAPRRANRKSTERVSDPFLNDEANPRTENPGTELHSTQGNAVAGRDASSARRTGVIVTRQAEIRQNKSPDPSPSRAPPRRTSSARGRAINQSFLNSFLSIW